MHSPEFDESGRMIGWKDDIGGRHKNGEGWNPFGAYCGKCSCDTCELCSMMADRMLWKAIEKGL